MHEAQCGRKESLVDWRWSGLVDGWLNRLAPAVGVLGLGMVRVEWGPSLLLGFFWGEWGKGES